MGKLISNRDNDIIAMLKAGRDYSDVANVFNLSAGHIRNMAIRHRVGFRDIIIVERDNKIVDLVKSGVELKEVAAQYRITPTTVSNICKRIVGLCGYEVQLKFRKHIVCLKCDTKKPLDSFRIHNDHSRGYGWRVQTCKECESQKRKEVYWENPDEGRRKSRESMRRLWKEKPQVIKQKQKDYRDKNRNKVRKWESEWYAKNEEGRKKHKARARQWHEKNRDALTDVYVASRITQGTTISRGEVPPALIKLKRLEIICKRTLKIKQHESH